MFLTIILKWILWKLKQLLTEKTHKTFMIYNHFLNLWIFINNSYDTSWRLYNFLWIWWRKSWNFYEISHVNICSMTWRNNLWWCQYSCILISIWNVFLKLTHSIMSREMCFYNMTRMMCYIQLFFFHKNWMLLNQIMKFITKNCL